MLNSLNPINEAPLMLNQYGFKDTVPKSVSVNKNNHLNVIN